MVRKYDEKIDERKQTYLAQKPYTEVVLKSIVSRLNNVLKWMDKKSDEILIAELSDCQAALRNILDNLTYTQ